MTFSLHRSIEPETRMTFAISGSSGLIGSALVRSLEGDGHTVRRLVRREPRSDLEIGWDPAGRGSPRIDARRLAGVDVVVNLAGENLAQRWSASARRRIRDSRINGTTLLARALAELAPTAERPIALLSGSAIGIYGSDRGNDILDETSACGDDFLATVARDWEAATEPAVTAGVRVVHLRTGIVLARQGGALAKMLPLFRLGLGGRLGDGRQWMSWIALADVVGAIELLARTASISGAVNIVAPAPVRNEEFTRTLARVLGRPAFLPAPRAALKLALGRMAEETALASQRVRPLRLVAAGYEFSYSALEAALRGVLS